MSASPADTCVPRRAWIPRGVRGDAKSLKNAQPFDFHLSSTDERVTKLARHIYDTTMCKATGRRVPRFYAVQSVIVTTLLNLTSAYRNDPARYVRYSQGDEAYYKNWRYNRSGISRDKLDAVICRLHSSGLIEVRGGMKRHGEFKQGRQTRMRATAKLAELIILHGLDAVAVVPTGDEIIILKGKKKKETNRRGGKPMVIPAPLKTYKDSTTTNRWRKNLERINARLAETSIQIVLTPAQLREINESKKSGSAEEDFGRINFSEKKLRRVFNNSSWSLGGRFYHGWWQLIPSEYRQYIQIDGQATEELDFQGMHFAILYAKVGQCPPDDPYAIPGLDPFKYRVLVKKAATIRLNSDSVHGAAIAFAEALRLEKNKRELPPLPDNYPKPKLLMEALERLHTPIAHLFGSTEGMEAQFTDSVIAERVMLAMDAEGIPVLPVHDSFIVARKHGDRLAAVMVREFEAVTKTRCGAKLKRPHREHGHWKVDLLAEDLGVGDDARRIYGDADGVRHDADRLDRWNEF